MPFLFFPVSYVSILPVFFFFFWVFFPLARSATASGMGVRRHLRLLVSIWLTMCPCPNDVFSGERDGTKIIVLSTGVSFSVGEGLIELPTHRDVPSNPYLPTYLPTYPFLFLLLLSDMASIR